VYESVEAFKLPQDNDSPQAMESMDALHNQFLTEFQGEGETRFISYIANEKSANGVPEHGLTPHAIEELNDLLEVAPGNIVVIKKRNTNSFFVSDFLFLLFIFEFVSIDSEFLGR
jgi:hypothetical protein